MKIKSIFLLIICLLVSALKAQLYPGMEELIKEETEKTVSKPIDFSEMSKPKEEKLTREKFEDLKRQKEARLRERLTQPEALEKAVEPRTYVVGPGDAISTYCEFRRKIAGSFGGRNCSRRQNLRDCSKRSFGKGQAFL
jgi:hypothetical protein